MLAVALSPQARALIQADRNACRPTIADRRRVEAALRERLGPRALPTETPLRDLLVGLGWQLPSGTALGLCLIGGLLFLSTRPASVLSARPASVTSPASQALSQPRPAVSAPIAAASVSSAAPEPAAPSTPNEPNAPAVSTVAARESAPDPLAQEVLLLSRAMTELHSGRATEALVSLNAHQLRFPDGALSQERSAIKAQVLCKLRRFQEARVELAGLAPGAIAYERILKACDSPAAAPPN